MAQTIEKIEEKDGIRQTWNIWPATLSRNEVVPLACLYNVQQPALTLPCEPIYCHSCQAVLCPQATIDFAGYGWVCVFCGNRNTLPSYARDITPDSLLPELMEENTTVEYVLSRAGSFAPVFLLLVDQCTYDDERHELMKTGLRKTLEKIPKDALVGIVRFGTNVELLSFGEEEIATTYLFSGQTEFTKESVAKLGIADIRRFVVPKGEKEEDLRRAIDELEPDPFPVLNGFRARRATGAALSLAASLLEGAFAGSPVRYMIFTQGPCTWGPGKVQVLEMSPNTSEKCDLEAAAAFYTGLGERINAAEHTVDFIAETMADIGVNQFRPLITMTGGTLIMAQDFEEAIKVRSIEKLFEADPETGLLSMGLCAKIQVRTSANLDFKGFIGEGRPQGAGWRVGSILPSSNITLLFENTTAARDGAYGHVQIITQFQKANRQMITRITSFSRLFSTDRNIIYSSFDQEAACVFQARAFIEKGFQNVLDFESAIDKNLIRFTRRYGTYEKGNSASVYLPDAMAYYPNFMFFFRRSLLVQHDGISGDEAAYFRILLHKLRPSEALKMIKPTLIAFHYQGDIAPVELDTGSLDPESILVLDSFHNVLLWKGAYVESWMAEGLHEKPDYEFFKTAIQDALAYSRSLQDRLPAPQYKETGEGKSQARILLHYVNPSQQGVLNTEKIDYEKFYDTLCRFIVRNE